MTDVIQTSSKVPYPSRLPPPRSRRDLSTLVVEEEKMPAPVDSLMPEEGRLASMPPLQSEGVLPMPLENPLNRSRNAPMVMPPQMSMVTSMAADALLNGEDFDPMTMMTADQHLDVMLKSQKKERRKQMQMASGVRPAQPRSKSRGPEPSSPLEVHKIHTSDEDSTPHRAIEDMPMVTP